MTSPKPHSKQVRNSRVGLVKSLGLEPEESLLKKNKKQKTSNPPPKKNSKKPAVSLISCVALDKCLYPLPPNWPIHKMGLFIAVAERVRQRRCGRVHSPAPGSC